MTDWTQMDPGTLEAIRSHDKLIAEMQGWTNCRHDDYGVSMSSRSFLYGLIGTPPAGRPDDVLVPYYTTSVDAALGLVVDLDWALESGCRKDVKEYCCTIDGPSEAAGEFIPEWWVEWADTPALAICRAWLAWKQGETE